MKFLLRFILLLVCILSSFVNAADDNNFYLGINVGSADYSGDGPWSDTYQHDQSFNGDDLTWGLLTGYQVNSLLAVELTYSDYGEAADWFELSPDVLFIRAPLQSQKIDARGFSLSAIVGPHITNRVHLFLELGISYQKFEVESYNSERSEKTHLTDIRNSSNGYILGLGASYKLTDRIASKLQWHRNIMKNIRVESLTLGAAINF